jgi:hypothetical protein
VPTDAAGGVHDAPGKIVCRAPAPEPPSMLARAKSWFDLFQVITTILGITLGGAWTYVLFVKDRQGHAQAVIEEKISHLQLTPETNYVQVVLSIKNSGHTLIHVSKATLMLQRLLPINGCSPEHCIVDDLNEALGASERTSNRFTWPLVASRTATWSDPLMIEPGESEVEDFEFVIPGDISAARVYSWIRNDELSETSGEIGWHSAEIYSFHNPEK